MRKASRIFLKHRPNAKLVDVIPYSLEGAEPNLCYQNACKLADNNEKELLIVVGWVVGNYLKNYGTIIIPHFWVANEVTNKFYDPTPQHPNDKQSYEYIIDMEIFNFAEKKNNEENFTFLPLPLRILDNEKLQAKLKNGSFIDLDKFDLKMLFKLNN
jgi:hypothetical protein